MTRTCGIIRLGTFVLIFIQTLVISHNIFVAAAAEEEEKETPAVVTREYLQRIIKKAKRDEREELEDMVEEWTKIKVGESQMGPIPQERFPRESLPDFLALLKEKDPVLQYAGIVVIYGLRSIESKGALVDYLRSVDFRRLAEGGEDADEFEINSYVDKLRCVELAIMTLGEIGDKSDVPFLKSIGKKLGKKGDLHEACAGAVTEAIIKLDAEGLKNVTRLDPNASDEDIRTVAWVVHEVRSPQKVPELIDIVRDANCPIKIREGAISALIDIKGAKSASAVLAVIKDKTYPSALRAHAAEYAYKLGDKEVETTLKEELADTECEIRVACLSGLAHCDPRNNLPMVLEVVNNPSAPIQDRENLVSSVRHLAETRREDLKPHRELLFQGLKALTKDGRFADYIRTSMWLAINVAFGEEPQVELSKPDAASPLEEHFKKGVLKRWQGGRPWEEIQRTIDERIKKIVVIPSESKGRTGP